MKKKLFLLLCAQLGILTSVQAADYLTDFSQYTVSKTAVSNDNTSGTAREFWRNGILGFDINGTSDAVPNGVYYFSVQGVYRGHLTADIPTGIIAYAESDGAQYMAPICNKTDGTVSTVSLDGFKTAFGTPSNYLNTIPYIIVANGKIKVGVKSMSTQPYCDNGMWFVFNTASFKVSDVTDAGVLSTALSDTKAQAAGLLASNSDETTERANLQSAYDAATATAADIVNLKQKIDAYLAKLVEIAGEENPLDVSYYFTNPKYSIRNLDLVGGLVTSGKSGALGQPFGWTCFDAGGTGDNGSGNKFQEGQGYNWFSTIGNTTKIDDHTANYDAEKTGGYSIYQRIAWNQWAEQTHSAKQTVTLPTGKYKVSVPAYASANNDDYKGYVIFTVNGTNDSRTVTASSWNVYEKEFTLTEPTEVSVDMQFNKLRRAQNVGSAWAFFDGVTLLTYGDPIYALKEELEELQASIDGDYLNNGIYDNVVGTERTNLISAKTITAAEETAAAYQDAINDVNDAINTFTAAKTNYDALVTEIAKAKGLGIADATADSYAATSSSTAATVLTSTQNLKVAEYNLVDGTYKYGVELGTWNTEGPTGSLSSQHWSGESRPYLEQSSAAWGTASWNIKYNQNVTLPSGRYVFKVAGRQANSDGVTLSLVVKKGDETIGSVSDFPKGDTGLGINTSGETDYATGEGHTYANAGAGRGWEWRYVKFTLAEDATVNVAVNANATQQYMWVSFCDATVQTDDEANIALITYNIALANAQTIIADGQYSNVTGSEKTALQAAIDADASLDKSDADAIEAATTALNDATTAFTGAKSAYDTFAAAKAVEYEDNLPYASSTKFAAIGTAQVATATSASDATAKTNAIISAYRLYVESNAMAEGVGGIDKTNLISDANFSGVTIDGQTAGAWAFSQTGGTVAILNGESFTDGDGNANYSYFDYNNNGGNNQNLSQTLTDLPKGQYLLTVTARATTAMTGNYYLSVDFDETSAREAIPAIGNTGGTFGRGWNDVSLVFNHVSDGNVTIHVYGENGKNGWSGATRFRLVKMDQVATIGATGWTTFASAYPLDLGGMSASTGDVKAYYASSVGDGKIVMTSTESEGVAAGTGLMLKGTAGATVTIPVVASGDAISGNMLVGCPNGETLTANANYYVLIKNGETAEFQSLKNSGATIPAGKAYLNTGILSPARLIISFEEDPTAINAVEAAEAETGALKDGKYLIGNKIVLVKNGVKYDANGKKLN